jgi:lipid A 3-O-deacylase
MSAPVAAWLMTQALGCAVAPERDGVRLGAAGDPADDALEVTPPERPRGSISLALENDIFAQTDRHYTNGVRLGLLFAPPRRLEQWAAGLGRGVDWGIVAGQQIYTPEDLAAEAPVDGDRPYAGWLYGGIVLRLRGGGAWDGAGARPVLDTFELDVGFVGRASLADSTQSWVHEQFGNDEPSGWDHQVEEGVAVQLGWLRQIRLLSAELAGGLAFDVVPHLGLAAGTVVCGARGGTTVRLGWNLPGDFGGLEDDVLALPLARAGDTPRPLRWGAWLLCRVDLRAIVFDVSLDGSLSSSDGPRVQREPLVASAEVGVMFSLGERLMLGYTHTLRSPEFRAQQGMDGFGSLFVQVAY